jgi:AbrB family looped-hinge helix DNA binding protein
MSSGGSMSKTVVSKKGQVVIPKSARDKLNLTPGTVLEVQVEKGRVIFEPFKDLPKRAFVHAGKRVTEPILREAKATSDRSQRLLKELGVECQQSQ